MVFIEGVQISRSFGKVWVNFIQLAIYLAAAVVYWTQLGDASFAFGLFLRVTAFGFFLCIILEILYFPKMEKMDKVNRDTARQGYLALLSLLKFLPLVLLIVFLTDVYM